MERLSKKLVSQGYLGVHNKDLYGEAPPGGQ